MSFLDYINGPSDLQRLALSDLTTLAKEIRQALIFKVSQIGGHLGPNLGIVELTVALHYVFDSPKDKIIYDVSHQCYVHKILTGRKDAFLNPENFRKVTGYSEPRESPHDFFTMGHTSTSISLACGMAKARDLLNGTENIISVIGDGALSGGEAFEGLQTASSLGSNFIIILNDNEMSISDVNGGLYVHMRELRRSKGKSSNNIFKAMGFEYRFIEDGHNIPALVAALRKCKDTDHPIVLHVCTIKGKGYTLAEIDKECWHWHPPFDVKTGENIRKRRGEDYDEMVGDFLLQKMSEDPKIVVLVAAVPATIGFNRLRRQMAGKQFIDVDIAEEHMLSMAAGLARNGAKPLVATFSTFYQRAYDQIAQDICLNRCPVTILIRNGSVWGGNDATHLGWFDLSLFSNIPNLVFLCPTNCEEYFAMLDWSLRQQSWPVAIRIPRNGVHHTSRTVDTDYSTINSFRITEKGEKVAIIALGDFYQIGERLASAVEAELGFIPTLVNPRYASGLDTDMLEMLKSSHSLVLTLEDSILDGGFGQKVASFYGPSSMKVINLGLKKEFLDGYNPEWVLDQYGITIDKMVSLISANLHHD